MEGTRVKRPAVSYHTWAVLSSSARPPKRMKGTRVNRPRVNYLGSPEKLCEASQED